MEKLGVFGGTFNPIHNGHLSLCTQLSDALGLAKVLLIPTAIPPHKRATELADGGQRLAMCRLAVQGDPRFCVCDLELRRQGNSYTADTLRELEALYPDTRMFLLMGTDMFLPVQNWTMPMRFSGGQYWLPVRARRERSGSSESTCLFWRR